MPDHSLKTKPVPSALASAGPERRQRQRMLLAVLLLLVAVSVVVLKDSDSRFPEDGRRSAVAPGAAPQEIPGPAAPSQDATAGYAPDHAVSVLPSRTPIPSSQAPIASASRPAPSVRHASPTQRTARARSFAKPTSAASQPPTPASPAGGPAVTATRAVLPPLRIEVVAGDRHSPVRPGSPSLKVDMQPGSPALPETSPLPASESAMSDSGPLTDASERVQVSTDSSQVLTHRVRPEYPLLARQMKVQGSVLLDAMIGKDGGIQDLHVVQGPTILADAAREAVRQWRFKPYLQDGQAVETQAHITVNFMISTN
jgi:TonB family protein